MGSPPVIPNGKGAAAVMVAAWASWVPAVSVVCLMGFFLIAAALALPFYPLLGTAVQCCS